MKHIFIVNPVSGKEDASVMLIPAIKRVAEGLDYNIELTQYRGHAKELAHKYADTKEAVRLYACGGDGTLNEVFSGAYGFPLVEVASVPCGSGNDFVRNFGTAEDFYNLADNINGTAVPIDLMRANGGISAAISSVGIDSDVAFGIPKFRRIPFCGGQMAYTMSIMQCLCSRLGKRLCIEVNGETIEDVFLLVAICNGIAYGGGYKAAPTANVRDGKLELVMVKKISRLRIAGVLDKYKNGEHIKDGEVTKELADILTYVQTQKIKITPIDGGQFIVNIDGECTKTGSLDVEVLPNAAHFVLPRGICK
ncbi:MAG: YegS/Rv2252/BmrU family lipid kinase [Oscillospiraceae bacterium]